MSGPLSLVCVYAYAGGLVGLIIGVVTCDTSWVWWLGGCYLLLYPWFLATCRRMAALRGAAEARR